MDMIEPFSGVGPPTLLLGVVQQMYEKVKSIIWQSGVHSRGKQKSIGISILKQHIEPSK
jgi:hypothetical protein